MDEHKLTELRRRETGEVPARTRFCPNDESISGYFEGILDEPSRAALKRHLVECRHCLARVGNLERLAGESGDRQTPGEVLAEAKGLVKPPATRPSRNAPAWSAAVVLILAVFSITLLKLRTGEDPAAPSPVAPPTAEIPRQVRNAEPPAIKPRILAPADGARIDLDDLTIKWTGVGGSLYYDVRVVDAEGFIIRRDRIEGATEWRPPVSHLLEPGMSYYVRVDAYLAGADNVSSDHVLFTVAEGDR